jgi:hypothetical protein
MNVACLAWGSLIWDPRGLPIRRHWFQDGPFAPIEFARHSRGDRITLVIDKNATFVSLLWAQMDATDLLAAKLALRDREGLTASDWEKNVGAWQSGMPAPDDIPGLANWATAIGVDAAIWTALGPKFRNEHRRPSIEEVLVHLQSLQGAKREDAERYIRRTPAQIDTAYRRQIEAELGWSYQAP